MQQMEIWPRFTDSDLRLLETIQRLQRLSPDGRVRSLFQVALEARVDYPWAHNRLGRLEALSCVQVKRRGPGVPLEMWLC